MTKIKPKQLYQKHIAPSRIARRIFFSVVAFILFILLSYTGMAWYVSSHKKELLASFSAKLNENLNGKVTIASMEPAFLQGFPNVSLNLKNVSITDERFYLHKRRFLQAANFEISVNALALFRGVIEIKKIAVSDAKIDLYTDVDGYSNASIFKKKQSKADKGGGTFPELRKFRLKNVVFMVDNVHNHKLFNFSIANLEGALDYKETGWSADIGIETRVRSMAFSTKRGSFIKNRPVSGNLNISYNNIKDAITINRSPLNIADEDFTVGARFALGNSSDFSIHISDQNILWKNASALLSPNISSRLDMFALKSPISVTCDIKGNFDAPGDPLIDVHAKIRNNELHTPGGFVSQCSFDGEFTNNYNPEKGFTDANSAIKLESFTGYYAGMPVLMKKAYILDLEKPIAVGDFTSEFDMSKLNNIVDSDLLAFSKGRAKVNVNYRADIINYKLTKPRVEGTILMKNADVNYRPRNLAFNDISLLLNFKDENLSISNIHLRTGKSVIDMEGTVANFLNLYYTAPEKILVNWKVHSPQLYLKEFLGFAQKRKPAANIHKPKGPVNFTKDVNDLFEKINVSMSLDVDKFYYGHFLATRAKAKLLLTNDVIAIRNASILHAGGIVRLNGALIQKNTGQFDVDATVTKVNINEFFDAFDNFGLESLHANNLAGNLFATAKLSGSLSADGGLEPGSVNGIVSFKLANGQLIDFEPIKSVGKYAFPFRDFHTISFDDLDGRLDMAGEKVRISPMQINSSILNMDVDGIYSFGKGTQIYIAVPLRNPKRDKDITDADKLAKRRNRGIVMRLIAADDKAGKVKISLGRNKDVD